MKDINEKRRNETKDIVKRYGIITADRIHLSNFPLGKPTTVFNPSIILEEDILIVYARVILGYYSYASSIVELRIPVEELKDISYNHYSGKIILYPDNKYDIWGCEDPRAYEIDGKKFITYTGRTVSYFNPAIRVERTLPVTAYFENSWKKIFVFKPKEKVISDKDAFLFKCHNSYVFFHRPHTKDENFYLALSKIDKIDVKTKDIKEIYPKETRIVLEPAKFESKIGWGTPPLKAGKEYLLFLHAVDKEGVSYKVFSFLMDKNCEIKAITPFYIMEPRENYEKYGDRPFVVFPCGSAILDDKIIISYGSADFAIGIGEIDLSELLSILDSNRVE